MLMRNGVCDYEDLSPGEVCLGGEMLEQPFFAGVDACMAQFVFTMWLTSSLIKTGRLTEILHMKGFKLELMVVVANLPRDWQQDFFSDALLAHYKRELTT